MQRRAIEDLIRDWPAEKLKGKKLEDLDFFFYETICEPLPREKRHPIYLWGVSEGYGTCAGIYHMNVAVFGRCKPKSKEGFADFKKLLTCYYAVLVSEPFEINNQIKRRVELMDYIGSGSKEERYIVDFSATGRSQEYVQLL